MSLPWILSFIDVNIFPFDIELLGVSTPEAVTMKMI